MTAPVQPLAKGKQVRLAGGKITVTDSPFIESKEIVGGYALCEFRTHEVYPKCVRSRARADGG